MVFLTENRHTSSAPPLLFRLPVKFHQEKVGARVCTSTTIPTTGKVISKRRFLIVTRFLVGLGETGITMSSLIGYDTRLL